MYISAFYLTSFLLEFKVKKADKIIIILITFINCLLICFSVYSYQLYFLFLLFLVVRFKRKCFKTIITFAVVVFSFIAFGPVITPHLIYRMQILNLTNSKSFMVFFLYPLAVLLIYYVSLLFKKFVSIHKFHYKVVVFINGKIYRMRGYYDSGNTLIYKSKPVVFINIKNFESEDFLTFEKVNETYITKYQEGEILIKNKVKKVIFAHSDRMFNGCECLLSAFVL